MTAGITYTFGPFELDTAARRLRRGGEALPVSDRHLDVLLRLLAQPGAVISKDELVQAGWGDVAVTDNSLEQAISSLRRALTAPGGVPLIETVPRRGYRFAADVSRSAPRQDDASLEALLAPHRAWLEGRAALETLSRDRAPMARTAFEQALSQSPDYAPAHVGVANACIFQFESTRADERPDRAALLTAAHHAREACRLDAGYAEAWATLGFALHRAGQPEHALAAMRRAVALEPDNWRVLLRLAFVSWGEERLRAAHRVLTLLPGLALAHWLVATVYVARQALERAEQELENGALAQDAQGPQARFSAVALHWLLGLVRLARGDAAGAMQAFERELMFEERGQLYARECCANTWYSIGAVAWQRGDVREAVAAFEHALQRVHGHPLALVGLAIVAPADAVARQRAEARARALLEQGLVAEAAMAAAVLLAGSGEPESAAGRLDAALAAAPEGGGGWILPVEPLLAVNRDAERWAPVLARLRSRAA